jgi:molybdopterin synthase sulfur carrier subunit
MAIVYIPSLLRKYADGRESVNVEGRTVARLVENLGRQYPDLIGHLVEDGALKSSIAVSVDGEVALDGMLEPVRPDSEVHFLPAISGGAAS